MFHVKHSRFFPLRLSIAPDRTCLRRSLTAQRFALSIYTAPPSKALRTVCSFIAISSYSDAGSLPGTMPHPAYT